MRLAVAIALIALSASAATPPQCDTHAVPRQIWKDPDTGDFWYCDRDEGWSKIETSSSGVCLPAGAGDGGCLTAGPQTISGDKTFAGDAGVGVNLSVLGTATSGQFCLASGACLTADSPYLALMNAPLELPGFNVSGVGAVSAIVSGQILMSAGSRLQSNIGNAGVGVYGHCNAGDVDCAEQIVNSIAARTAGYLLRAYNFGDAVAGVDYAGAGHFGLRVVPFGVGRGALVNEGPIGSTALTCGDSKECVYYGSIYGAGGGDVAMGLGAHGALGGPHASHVWADHYTHDGGAIGEWDNFTDGPNPPSKKSFMGAYGDYMQYGNSGFTAWPSLADYPGAFGNMLATFAPCPHLEVWNDGGVQFGGDAGIQQIGVQGDSSFMYDHTLTTGGHWFFCDENDGGTDGLVDAGNGKTFVGYNRIVDAWWIKNASTSCVIGGGGTCQVPAPPPVALQSAACRPYCSDNSSPANVSCSNSAGTITVAGTAGHTINIICL